MRGDAGIPTVIDADGELVAHRSRCRYAGRVRVMLGLRISYGRSKKTRIARALGLYRKLAVSID